MSHHHNHGQVVPVRQITFTVDYIPGTVVIIDKIVIRPCKCDDDGSLDSSSSDSSDTSDSSDSSDESDSSDSSDSSDESDSSISSDSSLPFVDASSSSDWGMVPEAVPVQQEVPKAFVVLPMPVVEVTARSTPAAEPVTTFPKVTMTRRRRNLDSQ